MLVAVLWLGLHRPIPSAWLPPPCPAAAMDPKDVRAAAAARIPTWTVAPDGRSLSRTHTTTSFTAGMDWFNAIAVVAEAEGHHPDLSLRDWNTAEVRLSTHALNPPGVSENDFIVAERIEALPVQLKAPRQAKQSAQ